MQTDPSEGILVFKQADLDFAADINVTVRKIKASGGTQVVFVDGKGNEHTFLAAEYDEINGEANWITKIKSTTDCTRLVCWL